MNSKVNEAVANGIDHSQPQLSPLAAAMQRHGHALVKANSNHRDQFIVDPRQLMVDLELATVRLEVLFLALIKAAVIDGNEMTGLLTDKLNKEAAQLEGMGSQVAVAPPGLIVPQ